MVRYSLAPGFELLSGDTLVASDPSRSKTLKADELPVVSLLLTGSQTLDELEQGLSVTRTPLPLERIKEVLYRLTALRVIAAEDDHVGSPAEAATLPEMPAQDLSDVHKVQFAPTDRVRAFRADLQISKKESGGLFDVLDPKSGKTQTMYDFEVSLARMLDGTTTFQDVLEAGVLLGIPLKAEGLNSFLRQLERSGLLVDAGEAVTAPAASPAIPRPPREEWDPQTRELFVTGVRLLRQGKNREAAGYFEAILEVHPDHVEAKDMVALAAATTEPNVPDELAPRPRSRVWLMLGVGLVAAAVGAAGVSAWYSSKIAAIEETLKTRPVDPPPAAAPTKPPEVTPPVAPPTPATPPDAGPAWSDDGKPYALASPHFAIVQTIKAPIAGTLHWTKPSAAPVAVGNVVGLVGPDGKLAITAGGTLGKIQPERAVVTEGQVVAIVTDSKKWELAVTGAIAGLEDHVACKLTRADGSGTAQPCTYRRDGEKLFVQIDASAARWIKPGGAARLAR